MSAEELAISIPMTRAERLIWQELQAQRIMLERLCEIRAGESIEEISFNKAVKLLKKSPYKILDAVNSGELPSITYRDKNKKIRYRFRVADIREYQRKQIEEEPEEFIPESAEEIAARIFGNAKEK